jgi:hypothetical protein
MPGTRSRDPREKRKKRSKERKSNLRDPLSCRFPARSIIPRFRPRDHTTGSSVYVYYSRRRKVNRSMLVVAVYPTFF